MRVILEIICEISEDDATKEEVMEWVEYQLGYGDYLPEKSLMNKQKVHLLHADNINRLIIE